MKTVLIYFILFLSFNVYGQSITWQKVFDGPDHLDDVGNKIINTTNGNLYILGNSFYLNPQRNEVRIYRLNSFGDTIWIYNTFGYSQTGINANNGSVVIVGLLEDSVYFLKLNPDKTVQWNKFYYYGYEWPIHLYDVSQTNDSGFIACGYILENSLNKGFITKVDKNGNLLWMKRYNTDGVDIVFNKIVQAIDEGYILAGNYVSYNPFKVEGYILKIDEGGFVVWDKKYLINNYTSTFKGILKIKNKYLICGNVFDGTDYYMPILININSSGDSLYSKIIKFQDNESFKDLNKINDNKFVISIETTIHEDSTARIIIIDSLGNILHNKIFPIKEWAEFNSVASLNNGDIAMVGKLSRTIPPFNDDVFVVRADSLLNTTPIGIKKISNEMPVEMKLYQNYPNPFNPLTTIKYKVPKEGLVKFKVYDIAGREIINIELYRQAGEYNYLFDGSKLSSGVYFYQIEYGENVFTKKMVLVK